MKKRLLLILLLCSTRLFAQTDTATMYVDASFKQVEPKKAVYLFKVFQQDSSYLFLTYNRLHVIQKRETYADQGLTIKHGQYLEYKDGKPVLKGLYSNNAREGTFISYDTSGRATATQTYAGDTLNGPYSSYWSNGNIQETGSYKKGKKAGEWKGHYENGKIATVEMFTDYAVLYSSSYFDEDGKATTKDKIESFPAFPGGPAKFYEFLGRQVKYPPDAAQNRIQGEVRLSFIVTETGEIESIKVEKNAYPSLDSEAVRVMRLSPKWIPGKRFGKNVRVRYEIPIRFSMR